MNRITVRENKRMIICNIPNNKKSRIYFVILDSNYCKRIFIFLYYNFSFPKSFTLKYTSFVKLYLNLSKLSFLNFHRLFCNSSIIFF